jgi:hypothetical protein
MKLMATRNKSFKAKCAEGCIMAVFGLLFLAVLVAAHMISESIT